MTIKGIIVAPPEVKGHHVDKFQFLLEAISKDTGFLIQWTSKPKIPTNTDIVLAYGTPLDQLAGLSEKIKLISMVCDIHTKKPKVRKIKYRLWRRADSIWTFEDENFERGFPQWYHKHVWMPMFFAPHERYISLPFNENPKMKCLLSGSTQLPWYPLRNYVVKYGNPKQVVKAVTTVPNWGKKKVDRWAYSRDAYAKWLNSYFCCITGSGNRTVHAKCMEISAAGSLLLTNMLPDMAKAGYVPKVHYLPVTEKDVLMKIDHCLRRPEKFEYIRVQGVKFVRARHSIENRRRQLIKVIEKVLNGENLGAVNCEWM